MTTRSGKAYRRKDTPAMSTGDSEAGGVETSDAEGRGDVGVAELLELLL